MNIFKSLLPSTKKKNYYDDINDDEIFFDLKKERKKRYYAGTHLIVFMCTVWSVYVCGCIYCVFIYCFSLFLSLSFSIIDCVPHRTIKSNIIFIQSFILSFFFLVINYLLINIQYSIYIYIFIINIEREE